MRAFIAICLPENTREALGALRTRLRAAQACVSWTPLENIHLTMRFLGEVDQPDLERLVARLAPRFRGCEPVVLAPRGVGFFPNAKRPSVFWAGIETLQGNLAGIQALTEEAARDIGLPPETKRFHPHLTLARIRDARDAAPLVAAAERERDFSAAPFRAGIVSVYRSELSPRGAQYTCLREFTLQ